MELSTECQISTSNDLQEKKNEEIQLSQKMH